MLNLFARDRTYFQTLRDNNINIASYNIDLQYNSIASYLNDEVVPAINSIIGGALPGILGNSNKYLHNKGDGTTNFDTIEKGIDNHSIAFSKLIKSAVNSVLATNGYGEVVSISTDEANNVLISQNGDAPVWTKLTSINIADGQVIGNKIANGSIGREHLKPGTLVPNIANGRIRSENFAANEITAGKFLNASITTPKLGIIATVLPVIQDQNRRGQILKQHIINGTLTPQRFADKSIVHIMFNKYKCLTSNKIAPDTITDKYLRAYSPHQATNAMFNSDILAPDFKLTRTELSRGDTSTFSALTCANFENVVHQAFLAKKCRDSQLNTAP
jgi:hypothetical protein